MIRAIVLATIGSALPGATDAAPIAFQCNAPFRESSSIYQERPAPARVTGRVEVFRLYDILPQPPGEQLRLIGPVPDSRGAEVELMAPNDSILAAVGIGPHERSTDTLEVVFFWQIGEETGSRLLTTVPRRTDRLTSVPFTIETDGTRVTVEAAGVRAEAPVALGTNIEVRIGCGGGEFFFEELDWGGSAVRR